MIVRGGQDAGLLLMPEREFSVQMYIATNRGKLYVFIGVRDILAARLVTMLGYWN